MLRRRFIELAPAAAGTLFSQSAGQYHLIAHRGGIVDLSHAENSPGSIQAAIDRGYRAITGTYLSWSLRHAVRYPHDRAAAVLGYAPRVGLADGFARLATWYSAGRDGDGPAPAAANGS